MVPPPCRLRVTCGVAPFAVKFAPVTVTSEPTGADAGLNPVMVGPALRITFSDCAVTFPAASNACTLIVFGPAFKVSEHVNDPEPSVAGAPLQATADTPDKASETVPVTLSDDDVNVAPFAGEVMLSEGGVRSMFTEAFAVPEFPAASVTVPLAT